MARLSLSSSSTRHSRRLRSTARATTPSSTSRTCNNTPQLWSGARQSAAQQQPHLGVKVVEEWLRAVDLGDLGGGVPPAVHLRLHTHGHPASASCAPAKVRCRLLLDGVGLHGGLALLHPLRDLLRPAAGRPDHAAGEAPAVSGAGDPPVRGRRPGGGSLETFQSFCPRLIDAELWPGPGPGYGGYRVWSEECEEGSTQTMVTRKTCNTSPAPAR